MSRSVKDYLTGINEYIFLPGLQREFVWSPAQMAELFDSLIRGYPIGILTEWNVRSSNVDDFHSYKFIHNYITSRGRLPDALADSEFSRYNDRIPENARPDVLIIDGQQRLNSLYIGVRGDIAEYNGGSGYPRDNIANWERKELCIDLLGHPDFVETDVRGDYKFQFRRVEGFGKSDNTGYKQGSRNSHRLWVPVSVLWNEGLVNQSEMRDIVREYVDAMPVDESTRGRLQDIASTVATDLYNDVLEEELKNDSVDHDTGAIPEIFQRLNTEGEDPKPYQLLMSRLMSYWPYAEEESKRINPRERVESWMDDFYRDFSEYERYIDRDLFMRYSAYLIKRDLLEKDIKRLSEDEMDNLREKWLGGGSGATVGQFEWFRSSLARAFETIIETGVRPRVMKNMPTFAVLGTFFYYNPDADVNEANRNAVFRFIAQCLLLNESYSVFTIGNARSWMRYLNEHRNEYNVFPGEELLEHENLNPSKEDIRLVVENARYSGDIGQPVFTNRNVTAILGLLNEAYTTRATDDISNYDVDHIFPRSKTEEIKAEVGKEVDLNRIGNLQLLLQSYNREEKREMWPEEWFETIGPAEKEAIKRVNQYPEVPPKPDSAKEFIEAREEQLIDHLANKYVH